MGAHRLHGSSHPTSVGNRPGSRQRDLDVSLRHKVTQARTSAGSCHECGHHRPAPLYREASSAGSPGAAQCKSGAIELLIFAARFTGCRAKHNSSDSKRRNGRNRLNAGLRASPINYINACAAPGCRWRELLSPSAQRSAVRHWRILEQRLRRDYGWP